jgi:polysaccharide export outer membrane protein
MKPREGYKAASLAVLFGVLAGCSSMPAFGPEAHTIDSASQGGQALVQDALPFQVVDITATTLPANPSPRAAFPALFLKQSFRQTEEVIEAGDKLDIRIWEVAEDGLFATAGNRETQLSVQVSNTGTIAVPYANAILAHGMTPYELRALLLESYKGRAVEPEITVSITMTEQRSTTVLGSVRNPGRFEIPARGIHLLDLIARAGGTSPDPWEVQVNVQRGSVSASIALVDITERPANNIVILPGDIVNISHHMRRFAVYGGVARPANIEIPVENANLAYLLAEVGGLDDRVAQTQSVYIFRPALAGSSAMAYRFDFSRPDAFLLADAFRLIPTDITYVASADAADFQRFAAVVLSPFFGAARSAASLGN